MLTDTPCSTRSQIATRGWFGRSFVAIGLAATLAACAGANAEAPAAATTPPCADYQSVASRPGQAWWAEQRWRYATDAEAEAAYKAIAVGQSPWPNWFTPGQSTLAPGTRFQMAMAPGQPNDQPGGFGTFDLIDDVDDVREYLAVLVDWKPAVDRVVTYEVVAAIDVKTGPVGPQVDPKRCALLPGRWSQFQMLVPPAERMRHLKVIEVRPIR